MKLSQIINENSIISELKAKDKKSALEELADAIAGQDRTVKRDSVVKVLMEREQLGTTGIGDGVAIPHGRLKEISRPVISFGRSKDGLDFESLDGQPTYLFFLLIAPYNSFDVNIQVLAKIARILKSSAFRKKLMDAGSREEIYQTIIQTDEELST
ncbi:Phosphoenolpyruvate-dependent sugar PTS family porter, EIIA 2 [uncultured Desulfobacterium sp.]|uniref:Phosphoenolpyruvate-dependent sugar PTS family porter, EIIA 2 n=1 Tax=uncultured Desulfobacterium sp. TaxID=201089 RepID=A0A445MT31_9BACT|nr:Phosphoenolpyruvate-dependent sugar PTS family porter, EIIA 2 [uncultured Desulfobacterium sp.]